MTIKSPVILSLRDYPKRANECRELLLEYFNEFTSKHPAEVLASNGTFPQGYFMLKENKVIGWMGLHEKEVVTGKVYGWKGSIVKPEIVSEELSPWITPLLVHPDERGNRYGKMLGIRTNGSGTTWLQGCLSDHGRNRLLRKIWFSRSWTNYLYMGTADESL
mgnify:CR=1 FL=1